MKKVLVFTGAGMSVPLGLPSTVDFIEEVQRGAKPVTKFAREYLAQSSLERSEDIEWILATLESFRVETPFVEYLLPHIAVDGNSKAGLPNLKNQLVKLKDQSDSEIVRIKKIIFEKLIQYNSSKAFSLYTSLLGEIKSVYDETAISMITTNYDLTFERAFEESEETWNLIGISTHAKEI